LLRSNTALATNSRDKIYGVLALSRDVYKLIPAPNYKLSTEIIYAIVTEAIVTAYSDLEVICLGRFLLRSGLPSWVPDFGQELPLTMTADNAGDDLYDATGYIHSTDHVRARHVGGFEADGLVLKARGFTFDVINGLGAVELSFKRPTQISEYIDYRLVQPDQIESPYSSEIGIFKALWTSLVLGRREYRAEPSDFLHSLYVITQASNSTRLAENFTEALSLWFSNNMSFEIHGLTLDTWFRRSTADPTRRDRNLEELTSRELKFLKDITLSTISKRLLFTRRGYIGMAPHEARKGDEVVLLLGSRVPVVLRKREEGGFELVGEVYVHGIMNGEIMTQENSERLEDFHIH